MSFHGPRDFLAQPVAAVPRGRMDEARNACCGAVPQRFPRRDMAA